MHMIKQFNEALAYIENVLLEEIDMNQMARIAGCSEYHFRRMFSFLAGMPLGEYIRRRRLSVAGELLQVRKEKVVDAALKCGYETPEAFSKAFLQMHGVNPSKARSELVSLKMFPPMSFQLTIKGGIEMDYRIVEKAAFQVVGFKKRVTLQYEGVNHQMDELWGRLTPDIIAQLKGMNDIDPKGIMSVSANFSERTTEGTELDQYVGVAVTNESLCEYERLGGSERLYGYDVLPVEGSVWAVFRAVGKFPDALQETWANIYAQWLPESGYELSGGPELLWNESPDTSKPDYLSEIWIPVRRLS